MEIVVTLKVFNQCKMRASFQFSFEDFFFFFFWRSSFKIILFFTHLFILSIYKKNIMNGLGVFITLKCFFLYLTFLKCTD